jgi:S-methylmethionine-dependent homocysteine/selenocysteine methylase
MLPQAAGDAFLTDGGVETDLIFNHGIDLPDFASFVMHDDDAERIVREYFRGCLRVGEAYDRGLVLETLTWRANSDWGDRLGYDARRLRDLNRRAVDFLLGLREREAGSSIRGVRVNASRKSHAELDESEELDAGDPEELGAQVTGLHAHLPNLNVLGGCCGTDDRHIEAIAVACQGLG